MLANSRSSDDDLRMVQALLLRLSSTGADTRRFRIVSADLEVSLRDVHSLLRVLFSSLSDLSSDLRVLWSLLSESCAEVSELCAEVSELCAEVSEL